MKKIWFSVALSGAVFFGFSTNVSAQINVGEVLINEIIIAPPGNDTSSGCEYVEFRGFPNEMIGDFTYVDVEGDASENPGTVNYIRSLRGYWTGSNGLLVIASSTACRQFTVGSAFIFDPAFQSNFSTRNNGTNSFLIYSGPLGYSQGQDLDVNDDGAEDRGGALFDGLSVSDESNSNDIQYAGARLGRRPGTPPGEAINAATRLCADPTRNSATAFYFGDLESTPDTIEYSARISSRSLNFPAGGRLTPSVSNASCPLLKTVNISGRVTDAAGRGVNKAFVRIINTNGEVHTTPTNAFGYFRFVGMPVNYTYTLSPRHKRLTFAEQTIPLLASDSDVLIVALN